MSKKFRYETKIQKTIKYRSINNENIQSMNKELKSYNWMELLCNSDTEVAFNTFHNILVGAFNTSMPEKTKR